MNSSNSKTPIINLKTLKIFYLLNSFVEVELQKNQHFQLLKEYNKIKEEEYKKEKEEKKPKRKYTKKTPKQG